MTNMHTIIDTTLREGEQSPGVTFTLEEKKTILDHLVRIGIDEAEVSISSKMHPCAGPLVEYCRNRHPALQLSLWSRCKEEDIEHAAVIGPHILSLSVPVSEILMQHKLGKDRNWITRKMVQSIESAKDKGLKVAVGFEDATRAEPEFLLQLAKLAERVGAMRIRLADTVGIFSPRQTISLMTTLRRDIHKTALAFHAHNDFGMATANSIAALQAGATSVDVVVLGLGERTGCARLEEVIGFLSLAEKEDRFSPEHLKPLSVFVAERAKRTIPSNRPIVGDDIFTCETGLHLQGLQNQPQTYEPFEPKRVCATRKLLFGVKSGRRAVEQKLQQLTIQPCDPISAATLQTIRTKAAILNRPLTDTELLQVVETATGH